MQAVVLAGGLATRMRPHTLTVPKAMLPVAGRPFVDWLLERLVATGVPDVVMCVAHLGEQIREHVGDGARFGARVVWSEEGPKLMGTAGAIRAALPHLEDTFLVTYGDSYLPFDYAEPLRTLRAHADCDGVMAVFKNAGQWDVSNVMLGGAPPDAAPGSWVLRYEKGAGKTDPAFDHIDYGATAVRRSVIEAIPAGVPAAFDAIQRDLAARKRLRGCLAHERFFEIGSPEGLAELDRHLQKRASS
jgi:N-acetyl-alpha-D-muramate 1-phosphate uridylyltransferase